MNCRGEDIGVWGSFFAAASQSCGHRELRGKKNGRKITCSCPKLGSRSRPAGAGSRQVQNASQRVRAGAGLHLLGPLAVEHVLQRREGGACRRTVDTEQMMVGWGSGTTALASQRAGALQPASKLQAGATTLSPPATGYAAQVPPSSPGCAHQTSGRAAPRGGARMCRAPRPARSAARGCLGAVGCGGRARATFTTATDTGEAPACCTGAKRTHTQQPLQPQNASALPPAQQPCTNPAAPPPPGAHPRPAACQRPAPRPCPSRCPRLSQSCCAAPRTPAGRGVGRADASANWPRAAQGVPAAAALGRPTSATTWQQGNAGQAPRRLGSAASQQRARCWRPGRSSKGSRAPWRSGGAA